ncbi:MAG: aspartate aminotransferase family protein, partial [Myxococcota bacterium]
ARAKGANVMDSRGNTYVDLSGGFAVSAVGHAHPDVIAAVQRQSERLLHALGDLHPSDAKIDLLERLCELAPWPARAALCQGGSEAVEIALKTATLASGRGGVLAFEGGYHGLSYGALAACGYSQAFRAPFQDQLASVRFAAYGEDPGPLPPEVGAVIVEPIQGRGGVNVPPDDFLPTLRKRCDDAGAVLIVDEIFTGLGRCGLPFVSGELADVLCLGKALGGGLPVSACVGRASIMAAWGTPDGEAIHTGTFYGHPLGCAAALASLDVLARERLAERATRIGTHVQARLRSIAPKAEVRGRGLMLGFVPQRGASVLPLVSRLLHAGFIVLPAGAKADVLQLAPPLTIDEAQVDAFLNALEAALEHP